MAKLFKFWVPALSKLSHAINATFVAAMPSILTCRLPLYIRFSGVSLVATAAVTTPNVSFIRHMDSANQVRFQVH